MLVVFVAALIVLVMLTNALSRSVRSSPLGKPDRILGAGFGVLCAWVAIGTAFLFYGYLGPHAAAAGGRGRRHLPDDQGNGQFRRTLPAAGLPHPPAGRSSRHRRSIPCQRSARRRPTPKPPDVPKPPQ